ncbi:MAG: SGNH/GDSL hydrolase family protein [Hamadaea sp.]|uniref:SGNH/GDSL hydrolase family protein n=1 Tax=Hamadaea sp. TaxID=2024425 RepID=UPI0017CE7D62|nr:SGNH/GDSL hydrolase family protein [Hamadaea sp.]NUR69770.1 SGNH/GDSL hydrolase family protein [Hamadaea sp.]NUT20146.1 SGNH/GDSL hydrolase family protein [Hamadaea sp.]
MLRRITSVAAVAALTLGLVGAPASASPDRSTTYYLALGDSLAAGYQPVTPLDRTEGYVWQLHRQLQATQPKLSLENLGCGGETSGTLLDGGICEYPGRASQLEAAERFLHAHKDKVSLVTIDIGGNDLNHCAKGGTIDPGCVQSALAALTVNLGQILARLRAVAPHTPIIGMTYYNPYLAAWLAGPAGRALALQSIQVSGLFNNILTALYHAADARVADVAGAFASTDLTTQVPLPGVGTVPLAVARICAWTWMCAKTDIHANTIGYAVLADAYQAEV